MPETNSMEYKYGLVGDSTRHTLPTNQLLKFSAVEVSACLPFYKSMGPG